MQAKHRAHLLAAAHFELAQPAPLLLLRIRLRLDPAKHLLDPPASVDRFAVALVAGGAAIDGRTTGTIDVLSDVRRHTDAAHLREKAPCVVVLVGTDGFLVGTGDGSCHVLGGIPLPSAHRLRHLAVHDQSMAVVQQHMAPIARLGRVGVGLAGQQGVGICAGAVGRVAELDATEITLGAFFPSLGAPKPSPGPDGGGGGSSSPSIRTSEAWEAQDCSKVPSTDKCSSLSSG